MIHSFANHPKLLHILIQAIHAPNKGKWIHYLFWFDFEIRYHLRNSNIVTDALSHCSDNNNNDINPPTLAIISSPSSNILSLICQAVDHDTTYLKVCSNLLHDPLFKPCFSLKRGLLLFDYHLQISNDRSLQKLIFQEPHASPLGGHSGIKSMLLRICKSFYWALMANNVQLWVQQCVVCQFVKTPSTKKSSILHHY